MWAKRVAISTSVIPTTSPWPALALKLGVPIWSNDNDFKELPLDLYPTAKLLKVLGI